MYFHTEQALGVGCPAGGGGCDLGQGSLQLRQFQRGLSAEGCFLTQFQNPGRGGGDTPLSPVGGIREEHHTFHNTIILLLHTPDSRVIQWYNPV